MPETLFLLNYAIYKTQILIENIGCKKKKKKVFDFIFSTNPLLTRSATDIIKFEYIEYIRIHSNNWKYCKWEKNKEPEFSFSTKPFPTQSASDTISFEL